MTDQSKKVFNDGVQNRELNQYWYSENTIQTLCEEIKLYGSKVAFLSTPSLYFAFPEEERKNFKLFEFDKKWESDPGFVFFDFNHPEKIPVGLWNTFDYIVVDPPFITKEVWIKYIEAVTTIGMHHPAKDGVASTNNFKVLFTTVLENHTMLEEALDSALFIPDFRPTVLGLVYQYNCFVNYPHISGPKTAENPEGRGVGKINKEIPAEEITIMKGRMTCNDLRESEVEFLAQMRTRKREGEQLLPQQKPGDDDKSCSAPKKPINDQTPITEMKWGYIPEGLQMYKDAADAAAAAQAQQQPQDEVPPETYGPAYVNALRRRETLEFFKKAVDDSFKKLDVIVNAKPTTSEEEMNNLKQVFKDHADKTVAPIAAAFAELCNGPTADKKDTALVDMMKKFLIKLSDPTLVTPDAAKEFAIDATRNFKSPAFNRQKELLQLLKVEKKKFNDAQQQEQKN
jgi:hypothetical protein